MKDRVAAGFISGLMAGVAMSIVDWLGIMLGFHRERLLDWAAVVIYGYLPTTIAHIIFAQLGQIFFAGFLGILLSVSLLKMTSSNYLLKGWIFGLTAWFTIYALSIIFRLPALEQHTFNVAFSHFLSASVYGLTLAYALNWLDKANLKI